MDVLKELLEEGLTLDSWTADGTELENIGQLAAILLDLQREVDHAEEKLKSVKEKLRVVQEGQLPAAKKDAAFDWLNDQGHGDIIKHTVSLDFKKGEAQLARTAISALMDEGFAPQDQTKVAPQTLKAFARVEVEAGRQLPDFFKLYIGQKATIK